MKVDVKTYGYRQFQADLKEYGWTLGKFGEVYGVGRSTVADWKRDGLPIWVWKVMVLKKRVRELEETDNIWGIRG